MNETFALIYCAAGNQRLTRIAIDAGFRYGAQLPRTVYATPYFADQAWKRPNRAGYMAALAAHRPALATVLDWERPDQLNEVLNWAEEVAPLVTEAIILIPKVIGEIALLPTAVGGRPIRLGYSVPTRYGGTSVPVWEFTGWPHGVHLLGGSPQAQMNLVRYLDVRSADGNYAQKMAFDHCRFWVAGSARYARDRWWPRLEEADGHRLHIDAPYEAFQRSCENIRAAWDRLEEALDY